MVKACGAQRPYYIGHFGSILTLADAKNPWKNPKGVQMHSRVGFGVYGVLGGSWDLALRSSAA